MNEINALLLSSARTSACNVLIGLLLLGPGPVATGELMRVCKTDNEAGDRALDVLLGLGLVTYQGTTKRTAWRVTAAGKRLALNIFHLAEAVDDPAAPPLNADTAPQLHAGQSDMIADKPQSLGTPENNGSSDTQKIADKPQSGQPIIIIKNINPPQNYSHNNKNNGHEKIADKPQSKAARQYQAHIRDVASALLTKGLPRPAEDNPFPPELRVCVQRLVVLGCDLAKSEAAVAHSPWDAPKIIAEIDAWIKRRTSKDGKNMDGRFCYLVAARVKSGTPCPSEPATDGTADEEDKYAGYLTMGQ